MNYHTQETPPEVLLGTCDTHVIAEPESGQLLHPQALMAFRQLCREAEPLGFRPRVVSGFRSFERQLAIWNGKACGQRPTLDSDGAPLDLSCLAPVDCVHAILRWSALPGASRHHWGTDFDVIDANALPDGQSVELTVEEARTVFGAFHAWLDEVLGDESRFGFYRPYAEDRGGVAPEPWHLSFAPLAREYARAHSPELLRDQLQHCDMLLGDIVCENLDALYERYVALPE